MKTDGKTPATTGDLLNSVINLRFHQAAQGGSPVTEEDWVALQRQVQTNMPRFVEAVMASGYVPDRVEGRIILLVKLRFQPAETGTLLGLQPSALSKRRSRLLKQMFGIDGPADEFDRRIQALGIDETAI